MIQNYSVNCCQPNNHNTAPQANNLSHLTENHYFHTNCRSVWHTFDSLSIIIREAFYDLNSKQNQIIAR